MKRNTVFAVAAVLLALLVLAGCQPASPATGNAPVPCNLATITEVDGQPDLGGCILRVAVENAYQPFNYIDPESGTAIGYDYDIFPMICERVNCQVEYMETSWDAMVAVMGGEGSFDTFDVGADGITITEERAQNVDFSMAYISTQQVLLVRIDEERFVEPAEFAANPDLIIGTQLGSTNYDAAVELVGEDRVTAFDQFGTAVQAMINGDVDAVMIDNVAGIGYQGVNADKVKLTGEAVRSEALGFIFGKGSPLVAPVDFALVEMEADGTLAELFDKWFNVEED